MIRYVVLLNFLEKGVADVRDSVARAEAFRTAAGKVGATVESQFWTQGAYDGVFVLTAPDETTAAALVLDLARSNAVRTCMMRAFDSGEFKNIADKLS